jgi:hypothetical protein
MELHTEDTTSDLSTELGRILEAARRQIEDEFRRRLEAAVREAESHAMGLAGDAREQAVNSARTTVAAELQAQFDETLQRTRSELQAEFERRMRDAQDQWVEEKERLQEQMSLWRSFAEAQRLMSESSSQGEILSHFLQHAEAFAPNLAVYVAKADGLVVWKTRGQGPFPEFISQDTSDPDAYFKPIVVREKTVAAICARQPYSKAPLQFFSTCLERSIEAFGLRLQNRKTRPVSA